MLVLDEIALTESGGALSHSFAPGTITVVLGRNGSGKTRLCRVLAGLDAPFGGDIYIGEERVTKVPPGKRSVALVYQAFVNYGNLSVADNIASPLKAAGVPAAERDSRVRELADKLKLNELLERRPDELSGGQQQRVAIGRALAKSAQVLVLDEPLVNLDYKLREALEVELREMLTSAGITVVYTTSDPRDAFNMADEVVLLAQHRILQSGPPLAVYEDPVSDTAADLMSDPGINRFTRNGLRCGVRPEHLSLGRETATDLAFTLELAGIETNGSETYLHGRSPEAEHWVARLDGLHEFSETEEVELYAHVDAILEFDHG